LAAVFLVDFNTPALRRIPLAIQLQHELDSPRTWIIRIIQIAERGRSLPERGAYSQRSAAVGRLEVREVEDIQRLDAESCRKPFSNCN
jgi:hypothetical protein